MARNRYLVIAPLLLLPMLLAGCQNDSWQAAGSWRPTGANAANLRAMIADPHDLTQGQAATGANGQIASRPVTAWLSGKSSGGGGGGSAGAGAGGAGGGGIGAPSGGGTMTGAQY